MTLQKCFCSIIACFLLFIATAQKLEISTVGKDPFNGKLTEITFKGKEGLWTFQPFGNNIIKTTYKPAGYTKTEQVSDAVITKPGPLVATVTNGITQTIDLENGISIVLQREKIYYKFNKVVKVKSASYFSQGDNKGFKYQLTDNEQFFGGGERALPMNRRGYHLNLYNNPSY